MHLRVILCGLGMCSSETQRLAFARCKLSPSIDKLKQVAYRRKTLPLITGVHHALDITDYAGEI